MKVLHVYRTYFPETQGGGEEVIRQICENTQTHGIESRVLTLTGESKNDIIKSGEAEIYRFHRTFEISSCGVSISALLNYDSLTDWADIIHYHYPWPFADLLHFKRPINKPTIMTYHSDIVRQQGLLKLYRPLMNKFLMDVDCIVATSKNYVSSSTILKQYKDKVEVIPIGINNACYPTIGEKRLSDLRSKVGEDFFLFIGVLRYYKGLRYLLDAIYNTNLNCVVVGSGPEEKNLRRQAARLNLNNVTFLGQIDDKDKVGLIKLCRAIVLPSHLRSEAFGVTLVEGAMYGKPLISTDIGTGTSYINKNGETGFVVPPADADALRHAMLRLAEEPHLASDFGSAACLRYNDLFTGREMGERYADLYYKLKNVA